MHTLKQKDLFYQKKFNYSKMQLTLIPEFDKQAKDDHLTMKANRLLEALNDGRKKEYLPMYHVQINHCIILIANCGEDILFNCLDIDGNTPKELGACWRVWSVIKKEMEIISNVRVF